MNFQPWGCVVSRRCRARGGSLARLSARGNARKDCVVGARARVGVQETHARTCDAGNLADGGASTAAAAVEREKREKTTSREARAAKRAFP